MSTQQQIQPPTASPAKVGKGSGLDAVPPEGNPSAGLKRGLGPVLLCGLMVGPILGSGIFILPPLVQQAAGGWSVPAWGVTLCLNAVFAFVFGFLAVRFPGNSGVADAVAHVFGNRARLLSSLYLIAAVVFGPSAVLLTITRYLPVPLLDAWTHGRMLAALCLVPVGYVLLLQQIRSIGTLAFVLSSISATLLCLGAVLVLGQYGEPGRLVPVPGSFDAQVFGHVLLMLFWCIVGWEVVGNYSDDVDRPEWTIPRAVTLSVLAVTLVELAVALAMQMGVLPQRAGYGVARLLYPLFGTAGPAVCAMLVTALCVTSYLMFVGGVARLVAALALPWAKEDRGNAFLFRAARGMSARNAHGVPVMAVTLLCAAQVAVLVCCLLGLADMEHLVAVASGFFLTNALFGVAAAVRLLPAMWQKGCAILLGCALLVVLAQSAWFVLLAAAVLAILCLLPWHAVLR